MLTNYVSEAGWVRNPAEAIKETVMAAEVVSDSCAAFVGTTRSYHENREVVVPSKARCGLSVGMLLHASLRFLSQEMSMLSKLTL
eukprot:5602646-Amphidinium_carterae.1